MPTIFKRILPITITLIASNLIFNFSLKTEPPQSWILLDLWPLSLILVGDYFLLHKKCGPPSLPPFLTFFQHYSVGVAHLVSAFPIAIITGDIYLGQWLIICGLCHIIGYALWYSDKSVQR